MLHHPVLHILHSQSYAGKYVPALGYHIHNANPSAKLKINLKGLLIGDGLVDPVNVSTPVHATYVLYVYILL